MKKRLLLFFVIITAYHCGPKDVDTGVAKDSKLITIETWLNTADDSVHLPLNERKELLVKVLPNIENLDNDSIALKYLSSASLTYMKLRDSSGFRQTNKKVTEKATELKSYKILGESHWDMAAFLDSYNMMDSAYFHYQKAFKNFDKLEVDSTSLALKGRMLYSMGQVQEYFKDYLGAEKNITEALRIFDNLEDNRRIYTCNNLLGIITSGMKNFEKAHEYHQKAGEYIQRLKPQLRTNYIRQNRNNIANLYLLNEDYPMANMAYSELLKDKRISSENATLYSLALVGKAYALFKRGVDYPIADSLLTEAIRVNDSIGFSIDQARAKQYYAELLAVQGDTAQALKYAQESKFLANEASNNDQHLEVLRVLTLLDSKNAMAYSNEFYELSETIKEEERAQRDKFARIRLETDEVIERNELLSRQKQIWIGVVFGLLLLGAALFVIVSQQISNNKLKFDQKQQESNQEIYNLMLSQQGKFEEGKQLEQKRISEELHDGILGEMLGIRLILSGLNGQNDEASVEQRAELIEKLRGLEEEIRTISHELNDAAYQKIHNFIVSLEDLVHSISQSSGISCSFTYAGDVQWDNLDGDIKINVYRIVQESLQNCVKHAQCKAVHISFVLEDNKLILTISDDGIGFDAGKGKRGIGIRNVTARVKKLNGTYDISSEKGNGTLITVMLPYNINEMDNPSDSMEQRQLVNV